ncbi:MAG: hypothetical protein H6739_39495 [Alphaproteobacteria bacterium]|nr:hypothetical protein [Alphaproteobacteria bacterium]
MLQPGMGLIVAACAGLALGCGQRHTRPDDDTTLTPRGHGCVEVTEQTGERG